MRLMLPGLSYLTSIRSTNSLSAHTSSSCLRRLSPATMISLWLLESTQQHSLLLIGAILVFVSGTSLWRAHRLRQRMPPGPRGVPFIGNKHQVPAIKPWRKFEEWNNQYGWSPFFPSWIIVNIFCHQDRSSQYISARHQS